MFETSTKAAFSFVVVVVVDIGSLSPELLQSYCLTFASNLKHRHHTTVNHLHHFMHGYKPASLLKASKVISSSAPRVRLFSTSTIFRKPHLSSLPILQDSSIETFKRDAFSSACPHLLPRGTFKNILPAIDTWFTRTAPHGDGQTHKELNIELLERFGDTVVPLEITITPPDGQEDFQRIEAPLSIFLAYITAVQVPTATPITTRIYLAQSSLTLFPSSVINQALPSPIYVSQTGKGDIYSSSLWLGYAPTVTPLHRDPNPNLFVQLCGRKVVRVMEPGVGSELFSEARRKMGVNGGGMGLGEDMMVGEGKRALDDIVWGNGLEVLEEGTLAGTRGPVIGYEATLEPGDGMFIPKGWWHSIKGVGDGIIGSVNWWFR
jgi:hypothetical protein